MRLLEASLTWWTWVWTSSRSWWWTGKPSVLQSMELRGVGHDWVTELNWNYVYSWRMLVSAVLENSQPWFLVVQSAVYDSLQPHGWQHTRLPCSSLSPGVCSNSYLLSQWCHPTISSSAAPFSCPHSFPASGSFPMSWPFPSDGKYWKFSFSPSNEYSGLISFRIDRFDLLAAQGTLKSLLQHHNFICSINC